MKKREKLPLNIKGKERNYTRYRDFARYLVFFSFSTSLLECSGQFPDKWFSRNKQNLCPYLIPHRDTLILVSPDFFSLLCHKIRLCNAILKDKSKVSFFLFFCTLTHKKVLFNVNSFNVMREIRSLFLFMFSFEWIQSNTHTHTNKQG